MIADRKWSCIWRDNRDKVLKILMFATADELFNAGTKRYKQKIGLKLSLALGMRNKFEVLIVSSWIFRIK